MLGAIMDPIADKLLLATAYIILAVPHKEFVNFTEDELKSLLNPPYIFFDLKAVYFNYRRNFNYWSL